MKSNVSHTLLLIIFLFINNSISIQYKKSDEPMNITTCYNLNYSQEMVYNTLTDFNVSGTFLPKYLQNQILKTTPNYIGSQLELCLYADWLTFGCWDMQLDSMSISNCSWTYFEGCFIGKLYSLFKKFLDSSHCKSKGSSISKKYL